MDLDNGIYEGTAREKMSAQEVADTLAKELPKADEKLWEALNEAIRYTGKSIPKMPIAKTIINSLGRFTEPTCPNCGDDWNSNEYADGMVCCWECGQAIDWKAWFKKYGRRI